MGKAQFHQVKCTRAADFEIHGKILQTIMMNCHVSNLAIIHVSHFHCVSAFNDRYHFHFLHDKLCYELTTMMNS